MYCFYCLYCCLLCCSLFTYCFWEVLRWIGLSSKFDLRAYDAFYSFVDLSWCAFNNLGLSLSMLYSENHASIKRLVDTLFILFICLRYTWYIPKINATPNNISILDLNSELAMEYRCGLDKLRGQNAKDQQGLQV